MFDGRKNQVLESSIEQACIIYGPLVSVLNSPLHTPVIHPQNTFFNRYSRTIDLVIYYKAFESRWGNIILNISCKLDLWQAMCARVRALHASMMMHSLERFGASRENQPLQPRTESGAVIRAKQWVTRKRWLGDSHWLQCCPSNALLAMREPAQHMSFTARSK